MLANLESGGSVTMAETPATRERCADRQGQVALRWLLEQENVVPIPGAKNANQVEHNAGALSFRLTPDEVGYLNEATEGWRT